MLAKLLYNCPRVMIIIVDFLGTVIFWPRLTVGVDNRHRMASATDSLSTKATKKLLPLTRSLARKLAPPTKEEGLASTRMQGSRCEVAAVITPRSCRTDMWVVELSLSMVSDTTLALTYICPGSLINIEKLHGNRAYI